ncbi:hypothetical protein MCUN1_003498 [Malassezia cuniculi]|uniref:Uncharacterized protein n=1 Tax=Malassezia cuniculi TaxID=948313 RepID=A0AAF0J7V5_9BASI|nr:hypothetical protein MCUN1_003498 [Malassezia cuniculi]
MQALMRLSATSRTVREWSLSALYAVLILPRHVRDFRRWFAHMQATQPPFPFMGSVRALFMAVDDITRLTASSAGWEAEMLRLLHYCGPTLTHLSLWQTESRALLRDASQAVGSRFATQTLPAWAVGEGDMFYDGPDVPGDSETEGDADLPQWLRSELEKAPLHDVARAHPAHFSLHARTAPSQRRRLRPRACTPTHLSLVISYPFYENERPELFAGLVLWTCVKELDVYITQETRRTLHLLALLAHRPVRRLRISTAHATLAVEVCGPDASTGDCGSGQERTCCALLRKLLGTVDTERALLHSFSGRGMPDASILRAACLRTLADLPPAGSAAGAHAQGHAQEASATLSGEIAALQTQLRLRLNIVQGGQAVWGKLKHRLWDFRERAQFGRDGAWPQLLGD